MMKYQANIPMDPSMQKFVNIGRKFIELGRYSDAIRFLSGVIQKHPEYVGLNMFLGLAYYENREYESAIRCYSILGANENCRRIIGYCYYEMGNYVQVIEYLDGLNDHGSSFRRKDYIMLADSYGALGRINMMKYTLNTMLQLFPDESDVYLQYVQTMLRYIPTDPGTLPVLVKYLAKYPDSPLLRFAYAKLLKCSNRIADAIQQFLLCGSVMSNPEHSIIYKSDISSCYIKLGMYDQAFPYLVDVVDAPVTQQLVLNLMEVYMYRKEFQKMIDLGNKIRDATNNKYFTFLCAYAYCELQQYQLAVDLLNTPDNSYTYDELSLLFKISYDSKDISFVIDKVDLIFNDFEKLDMHQTIECSFHLSYILKMMGRDADAARMEAVFLQNAAYDID